jgi:Reverse transcriptase (RNA-dependent DNA polymerase).
MTPNPKTTPSTWQEDDNLEARAAILRQRIEDTFRHNYADVLDCEPQGVNHNMPHEHIIEILEGAQPYSRKLKRLSPLEMELLNKYIKEMVDGGRIRPSDSPWGANVLFVPKPVVALDVAKTIGNLNKRMKHDTYPLPRIDVHMDMAQGTFWTKMDLLKGFYQLPMHPDSIKYTAFNTLIGKYEFLVMPMGLQSAPGSFMRAMNQVFDGLMWDPNIRQDSGILVYLDDILLFSQTRRPTHGSSPTSAR